MGKGEIARYEQFLLFPQCFQKACVPGASKGVIVWEWVKAIYWKTVVIHYFLAIEAFRAWFWKTKHFDNPNQCIKFLSCC